MAVHHWDDIYQHKASDQLGWTQPVPATSLDFVRSFQLKKTDSIIDIGGGDSKLVDYLLAEGFVDITVLDISESALKRAKNRLGAVADRVKWIVSDITTFKPNRRYVLWHDRAAFHFLTEAVAVSRYLDIAKKCVSGFMTIGTFSLSGPAQCSGLPVRQYDEPLLTDTLATGFDKIKCVTETHVTPFNTRQSFLFCSFKRKMPRL